MKDISAVSFLILPVIIVSLVSNIDNTVSGADTGSGFGGLSAESVEIVEENTTDLIKKTNDSTSDLGGLSAESIAVARNR